MIRKTEKVIENGFEEIYVNTKEKDNSEPSELMKVFVKDAAYNPKFPITSHLKHCYKKTEEGQQRMCEIMEKIVNQERNDGKKEGVARINQLNTILIQLKRYDDLEHTTFVPSYQTQLMMELLPEEV